MLVRRHNLDASGSALWGASFALSNMFVLYCIMLCCANFGEFRAFLAWLRRAYDLLLCLIHLLILYQRRGFGNNAVDNLSFGNLHRKNCIYITLRYIHYTDVGPTMPRGGVTMELDCILSSNNESDRWLSLRERETRPAARTLSVHEDRY